MEKPIRVLIVDGHALTRAGLASALGSQPDVSLVAEASDGFQAIEKAIELRPDIIVMDIFMPRCGGLGLVTPIKDRLPYVKVLILTTCDQEDDFLQAMRLGVDGYVLKTAPITEIVDGIRRTAAGETILSPRMAAKLVAKLREERDESGLSSREREVLELLTEGLTDVEIANRLFISQTTVRTYLRRLLDKLNLRNRVEAAAYGAHQGLRIKPF
jgi:DNA-binding NarL/FixJ family response regulator